MNHLSSSSDLASSSSSSLLKRKWNQDDSCYDDEHDLCRSKRPKHDVFLNYSSEDIGKSFVSHLKGALKRNGFAISDHTTLPIGRDESSELLKAIEDSGIYVVVLSANYSSSVKCLDELVFIMDSLPKYYKNQRRLVFPIFYNVDPSHVRSQLGTFEEAFDTHETSKIDSLRVEKWRKALKDAGRYTGLHLQNGDEEQFLQETIKALERLQHPIEQEVTDHPVGIGSRVEKLITKLRLDSIDVIVVAVFGLSGIGKTTIAEATYNRIKAEFDLSCFIANIHYLCMGPNWKVELPKVLISCLTQNDKSLVIGNYSTESVTKIKKLISGQKALLVLDDVDNFDQLEALGINPVWFHPGSRIIVTTRDKWALSGIPYASYHTKSLNERESLNLFTQLMFAKDDPRPVNIKFMKKIVSHAGGLPLVLKVWSRHFKQFEREDWPTILETLKRIPLGDVQKQLQMSYDSLSNRSKKLFLDIVCFFDEMDHDLVAKILEDKDNAFLWINEIAYLVNKSLVKSGTSKVEMHHVIREMGQEIVRQENEEEPGKRTRLWDDRDVHNVLAECSGTESVESIMFSKWNITVQVEALRKMSNLRLIKFRVPFYLDRTSSNQRMPLITYKKLRYMEWYGFPFKCINYITMGNVVALKLENSKLEILWEGVKILKKLRILDVNLSSSLTKTGDFFGLENLEELYFSGCCNLKELHNSIGCLNKLAILDLSKCTCSILLASKTRDKLLNLQEFQLGDYPEFVDYPEIRLEPSKVITAWKESRFNRPLFLTNNTMKVPGEVGKLTSLKHLDLSHNGFICLPDSLCQLYNLDKITLSFCNNLESVPNLPPNITSVSMTQCTSLVYLPSNMSKLKFLKSLWLDGCCKLGSECLMKITELRSLCDLCMDNCNLSQVPNEIGNLVSLKTLYLSGNPFSCLPESFKNLAELFSLHINNCCQLQVLLAVLPSNLKRIEAKGSFSLNWMMPIDLRRMDYIYRTEMCKESPINKLEIYLTNQKVPDWLTYGDPYITGHVLSFVAPLQMVKTIRGMIICVASHYIKSCLLIMMHNRTKKTSRRIISSLIDPIPFLWVTFYPLDDRTLVVEAGDIVELQFHEASPPQRKWKYGLRLIYEGDMVDSKLLLHYVN